MIGVATLTGLGGKPAVNFFHGGGGMDGMEWMIGVATLTGWGEGVAVNFFHDPPGCDKN